MSNVKLTYFNSRGLGDTIRFLLKYGDIEFEDIRITYEDWSELKSSTPFGQLPLYEEDGKTAWQSIAIARYVAKKVKLTGDNDWENLEIDAIADTINDLRTKSAPIFYESDEEKKKKLRESFLSETLPYYLERFEKIVEEDGYLATKKLTWADIYFSSISELFQVLLEEDVLEKYTNLSSLKKKVQEIPAIKSWIENRPKTQF